MRDNSACDYHATITWLDVCNNSKTFLALAAIPFVYRLTLLDTLYSSQYTIYMIMFLLQQL